MNSPDFDGFTFDGVYFEAACDGNSVSWSCHEGCEGKLEVPMARLWSQKLGTIKLECPECHSQWQMELTTLSKPIRADIIELGSHTASSNLFSHSRR